MRDDSDKQEGAADNPLADYGKKLVALGLALQDGRSTIEELACLAHAAGLALQFRLADA